MKQRLQIGFIAVVLTIGVFGISTPTYGFGVLTSVVGGAWKGVKRIAGVAQDIRDLTDIKGSVEGQITELKGLFDEARKLNETLEKVSGTVRQLKEARDLAYQVRDIIGYNVAVLKALQRSPLPDVVRQELMEEIIAVRKVGLDNVQRVLDMVLQDGKVRMNDYERIEMIRDLNKELKKNNELCRFVVKKEKRYRKAIIAEEKERMLLRSLYSM